MCVLVENILNVYDCFQDLHTWLMHKDNNRVSLCYHYNATTTKYKPVWVNGLFAYDLLWLSYCEQWYFTMYKT